MEINQKTSYRQLKKILESMSEMSISDIESAANFRAMVMLKDILSSQYLLPPHIAEGISLRSKIDLPQDLELDELEGLIQPFAASIAKLHTALLKNGFSGDAMLDFAEFELKL